jgi:hypothetical protein
MTSSSTRRTKLHRMLFGIARLTIVFSLFSGFIAAPSYAAGAPPRLEVSDSSAYNSQGGSPVIVAPTLTITDDDDETLDGARVSISSNFSATTDRLGISGQGTATSGTISGVPWAYNTTTGVLTFSGNAPTSTYQNILRLVVFYANGTPEQQPRTVEFTLGSSLANPTNGHFYEFVSAPDIPWSVSRDMAATSRLFGLQGYLATVTSQSEANFIQNKLAGNGWIGASDAAVDGEWRWVTGPENGTQFWQGGANGSAVNGQYHHWHPGEPSNLYNAEHYAHILGNPAFGTYVGFWNDLSTAGGNGIYEALGYVIEYGGMAGDPALKITDTATVNVRDLTAPTMPVITTPVSGSVTSNQRPLISGTAEANSTVTVIEGGETICTAEASASGDWSCTPGSDLAEGLHTVTATARDAAGNISPEASTTFTIDITAPISVVINGPVTGSIMDNRRPLINGTAEANSTVTVIEGGETICTVEASASGDWSCTPSSDLVQGLHTVTATARDAAGNISPEASTTFTIVRSLTYVPLFQ